MRRGPTRDDAARQLRPGGLTTRRSSYGPKETMDRVAAAAARYDMTVLARIDHAAAAAKVGLSLGPTEIILFGNARAGTLLMQAAQTTGIDLPLKVLVWQDAAGIVWIGTNDPEWIGHRHGLDDVTAPVRQAMRAALIAIATEAGAPPNGTST